MSTLSRLPSTLLASLRPSRRHVTRQFAAACTLAALAAISLDASVLAAQGEPVDRAAVEKIRREAFEHSQVMTLLSWLTDVHGPRLTGSPTTRRAADFTVDRLRQWGLSDPRIEAWPNFGRGWTNEKFYAQVTAPVPFPIIGYPQAWTPGTTGLVKSQVVYVKIDSDADFANYKGKLAGKIVMLAPMREVPARFEPLAARRSDASLETLANAPMPQPAATGPRQSAPRTAADSAAVRQQDALRANAAVAARRMAFIQDEKVAAVLEPGRGDGGTVFTNNGQSRDPKTPFGTPLIAVAIEHYGRILRTIEKGVPVEMELEVRNTFHDGDLGSFNILAEIPGTDPQLKNEVVMLGAHFDSWHAGTGATDNAAGSAAMLEAVRVLQAAGLKPKRTIRIALWTGEEQGLLGSRAYVRQHLGTRDSLTEEGKRISGYFNLDNGTGAIRGVYLQGNSAVAPIFSAWMQPFADKGVKTVTLNNTGGTDHLAFDGVGIPGFQFIQDEIEYGTRTHHSNMDTYERLQAPDMQLNAAVIASFVWHAANRAAPLPRKPSPNSIRP
ncbi:MAG: M20/M25/M40 family metallo-hydrolase [Gemmatimonadetes bacterium]|nr:M20/M25/M40 family metallo-hydrolase [Gemmatimonadota bacterium]